MKRMLFALGALLALSCSVGHAQTYNLFAPGPSGQICKSNTTWICQQTLAADISATFTGLSGCSGSAALLFNATCAPVGTGTVTSITITVPAPMTATGCTISASGTCAITWTGSQTANEFLATPNSTAGAVGLRKIVTNDLTTCASNEILFNNGSGVLSCSTSFQWNNTSNALLIGTPGTLASVFSPNGVSGTNLGAAGNIVFQSGNGAGSNAGGSGGTFSYVGGTGGTHGAGGSFNFTGGDGGSVAGNGGGFKFQPGVNAADDVNSGTVEFDDANGDQTLVLDNTNTANLGGGMVGDGATGGNEGPGTANLQAVYQQGVQIFPSLPGTTGSIGGSLLAAGACSSGTVAVSGASNAMAVSASPVTYPGDGNYWLAYVSAAGTVTVKVCAAVAGTPGATAYNVRVIQ